MNGNTSAICIYETRVYAHKSYARPIDIMDKSTVDGPGNLNLSLIKLSVRICMGKIITINPSLICGPAGESARRVRRNYSTRIEDPVGFA